METLTFGAQTGRGSDCSCAIKRTTDYQYFGLISLVHQLAQNAVGPALPYLGFQVLKLGVGQNLNQQRDYHNHPDYLNHTMKFGRYRGGSLQMLRDGTWHSYEKENQWFDAVKVSLERNEEQHPRQHSLQHPEFSQRSSQHPPQLFLEVPVSLFCSRPPGSQRKTQFQSLKKDSSGCSSAVGSWGILTYC